MTESTLSATYAVIQQAIRDFLGEATKEVDSAIAEGYRMALVPPPVGGVSHTWTFLEPLTSLTVWPSIAVGSGATVTGVYSAPNSTVTMTPGTSGAAFYPLMIGSSIVITGVGTFTVTGYTSATVITVSGDATGSNKTFSMTTTGEFALPDDFGDLASDFYHAAGSALSSIRRAPEGYVRHLYELSTPSGIPQAAAIVPRPFTTSTTTGGRWNLLIWPLPSAAYVLTYKYRLLPNVLSGSNTLPVGGMEFGSLVLAAGMAAAEKMWRGGPGPQMQNFLTLLAAAVARDSTRGPANLGTNEDHSDDYPCAPRHGLDAGTLTIAGHV